MRAATIHAAGEIRFSEVPDPVLSRDHQAIVRVVAGCICGSDLWPYREGLSSAKGDTAGQTIGHECVGVVEEVGAGVTRIRAGEHVIVPFCHGDGTCAHCRHGMTSACEELGFTTSGQGEFALVQHADASLVRLDGAPDADALPALLTLSDVMPTGWHAATSAGVRPGDTVVVVGDGAVGLCGVLASVQLGAERVIAMSRHAERQALARSFGATDVVAERDAEGVAAIEELTQGVGADAVLECVGTNQAMHTALAVARPGSTVGFVGVPHQVELPVVSMFSRNVGLRGGIAPVQTYLPQLLDLVLNGTLDPGPVFDLVLPMAQVAEGYRAMDERRAVKVMLRP